MFCDLVLSNLKTRSMFCCIPTTAGEVPLLFNAVRTDECSFFWSKMSVDKCESSRVGKLEQNVAVACERSAPTSDKQFMAF